MPSNTQSTPKSLESKNDSPPDRFVGLEEMRRLHDEFSEMIRKFKQKEVQRVNVSSSQNELYCETDIRRQVNGKWRDVDDHDYYFSARFEGDTFMEKWNAWNSYDKYRLGVKHINGYTTSVENNKIVKRNLTDQGEEFLRFEHYIENERLQRVGYSYGKETYKFTYERYANPEPE